MSRGAVRRSIPRIMRDWSEFSQDSEALTFEISGIAMAYVYFGNPAFLSSFRNFLNIAERTHREASGREWAWEH